MLTLYILISILLLQSSHAADTDQTVDQLNAWRNKIRKFRYNLVNMDENDQIEWNHRYNIALIPQNKCWDQLWSLGSCPRRPTCSRPNCSHKYLSKHGEDLLSWLFIADIVPSGAPITLESLKKLPEDLSQDFLELYWEFYETIMCARKAFRFYLWRTSKSVYKFDRLQLARNSQEQLMQNILSPIVGPTNNRIRNCVNASAFCATGQPHICTTDDALEWCERDSRIESSAHDNLLNRGYSKWITEELIYYISHKALIFPNGGVGGLRPELGIFLKLCPDDVPRKYLKLAEKVHFLHLRHSIHDDTVTDLEKRKSLYSEFHAAALLYRKKQTCMLENLLTKDTETYFASEKTTERFPELGIFLKLRPFEVPPQYLELAEKVHSAHFEYCLSHDIELPDALTMAAQPDEMTGPPELLLPFQFAAESYRQKLERISETPLRDLDFSFSVLKEVATRDVLIDCADVFPELCIFLQLHPSDVPPPYFELAELVHALSLGLSIPDDILSHASRNDVAYADLSRATMTESNRGSRRRAADIAGPSSSSSHRVGSLRNHRSSGDRRLPRGNH
ncbi:hypothetical protein SeLEV6574_g01720 [Synchytrium endobioticum]|uniref:Uncharacterized protein n=1 Tax=Synchytrium endobioticum TaxID=286115 RepID=A0A507DCE2_9FUNG|nr:hypothetical protein SeLEV6574_g01720 [Synchytrium endobioticum]